MGAPRVERTTERFFMDKLKRGLLGLGAIVLLTVGLSACSTHYTDPSMVALRYEGGPTEGGKFVECVEPGDKQVSNDSYYPYPTSQREAVWDGANFNQGTNSADYGDLAVTDKDGNLASLKIKVTFTLNTDCDVLRTFHEKIGRTRQAYFNNDGTYGNGWLWAMTNYIGSALEQEAKGAAIGYTVDDMWLNPGTREEISSAIEERIQNAVNEGMEGDEQFYNIGAVRVFGAEPDAAFKELYQERKAAAVRAETAEANKVAQIKEAQAKTAVARQEALARRAEIAGYGNVDAYLKALMIEQGMNPYQPSYGGSVVAPSN